MRIEKSQDKIRKMVKTLSSCDIMWLNGYPFLWFKTLFTYWIPCGTHNEVGGSTPRCGRIMNHISKLY